MRRVVLGAAMLALLSAGIGSTAPPRRERIVFASGGELYAVAPEGGRRARLTRSAAVDSVPRQSPGGTRIAFVSDRDGNEEIYVMDVDGRRLRRLTTNPRVVDTSPSWSPDGSRIAYASGTPGELDLYVMNADGSGKRPLVRSPGDDAEPAWSPVSEQIVFSSNRGGAYDLWAVDAAGGEPNQLTALPGDEREPAWSPDATRLAFVSNRDANQEIYVLNIGGAEPARVTADAGATGTRPGPGTAAESRSRATAPASRPCTGRRRLEQLQGSWPQVGRRTGACFVCPRSRGPRRSPARRSSCLTSTSALRVDSQSPRRAAASCSASPPRSTTSARGRSGSEAGEPARSSRR